MNNAWFDQIMDFAPKHGFALDFKLSPSTKRLLLDSTLKDGTLATDFEDRGELKYWIFHQLRIPEAEGCYEKAKKWLSETRSPDELASFSFYMQMHPGMKWKWIDHEAAQVVQRELQSIFDEFFESVSSVIVLIQKQNCLLPPHRDIIPGNKYSDLLHPRSSLPGEFEGLFLGEDWFAEFADDLVGGHEDNRYFTLRIPLGIEGRGFPFIYNNYKKDYYTSNGRAFFLNDTTFHGADPVDFPRGVLIPYGKLKMEALDRCIKHPLKRVNRLQNPLPVDT